MSKPKRIFITGASSGIGHALALHYAAPGVTLGLLARREELLKTLGTECEEKGARALQYPVDVTNRADMAESADHFISTAEGADLVIANAGASMQGQKLHIYLDAKALKLRNRRRQRQKSPGRKVRFRPATDVRHHRPRSPRSAIRDRRSTRTMSRHKDARGRAPAP